MTNTEPTYRYRAICTRVTDGDTYQVLIDLGFNITVNVPVRLHGVDCPEITTESGKLAKTFAKTVLLPIDKPPTQLILVSYKDQRTFARWVADIFVLPDGQNMAQLLVNAGFIKKDA